MPTSDPNAPRFHHIAVLGSSFAAGPGIGPVIDRAAGRSGRNYAHLVAEFYGSRLTDLSVSGATTSTILDTSQRLRTRRFAPQISLLPEECDLVLITAGGNDLGYSFSLWRAGWGGWLSKRRLLAGIGRRLTRGAVPTAGPYDVARAAAGLARVVSEVRSRSPHARVLLVDYPTVIGATTTTSSAVPLDDSALKLFRRVGQLLTSAFEDAAASSAAELVQVSALSEDHAVESEEPWMVGFAPRFSGIPAFHPNAAGHAAIARAIERYLMAYPLAPGTRPA
ncbi:SGNH/GDSL hydrolase family protein [Lacisediminihabitans sp. FW035]